MDEIEKSMSTIDPVIYMIFFVTVIIIILSLSYSDRCKVDSDQTENFAVASFVSEEIGKRNRYKRIILKKTKFYFLTVNNPTRKAHIKEEFKEFSPIEINPVTKIPRNKSGATGFARMVDRGLRDQDRTKPFQPFIMLEDDASKYRPMPKYLDIPLDADLVYLGLHNWGYGIGKPIPIVYSENYDKNLMRVKNLLALHGVMVCSAAGAALMERCMMESYFLNNPWDIPITHAQPFYRIYALKTPLIYQEETYGGKEDATMIVAKKHWFKQMPNRYIKRNGASNLMSSIQDVV